MLIGWISSWLWIGSGVAMAEPAGDRPRLKDRPAAGERWREYQGGDEAKREAMREKMRERWERSREDAKHRNRELTDEQVEAALAVIKDVNPEAHARLIRAMEENPERAKMFIAHMYPRIRGMVDAREKDPDHYRDRVSDEQFNRLNGRLAHEARKAKADGDDQAAEELTAKLRANLEKQFEVRQRLREKKLETLEKQLELLRKEVAEHAEKKDLLIDKALADYLKGRGDHDRPARDGDRGGDQAAGSAGRSPGPPPFGQRPPRDRDVAPDADDEPPMMIRPRPRPPVEND